jgi:hypothetical protein
MKTKISKDVAKSGVAKNKKTKIAGNNGPYIHESIKSSAYGYNPTGGPAKGQNKIFKPTK